MMSRYESLADPNHEFHINENNFIIAVLRQPKDNDSEQAFLLMESINAFDKRVFTKYDCIPDVDHEGQYKIEIDQRVVEPEDSIDAYLDLLDNNKNVLGKIWNIRKGQAEKLHQNILDSQKNPGKYNPLGDTAFLPQSGDCIRDLSPGIKGAIVSGAIATTGVLCGPQASAIATSAIGLYSLTPDTIKEPITEGACHVVEAACGHKAAVIAKNSLKPSGDNSFTWARNMLYSINDKEIIRTFPKHPADLIVSVTSRHLDARKKELRKEHRCRVM